MNSNIEKRIRSVLILVLALIIFIKININEEQSFSRYEKSSEKLYSNNTVNNVKIDIYDIDNIETKSTLDNLVFTVEVTSINIGDSEATYIIKGNTTTKNMYSGEIWIKSNNISDIVIDKTYKFTVEPLMSFTKPTVVTEVKHCIASEIDVIHLHENRERVSNYSKCMAKYTNMTLEEIILSSNNEYMTWTNEEIEKFKSFINKKGYNEELNIKSVVYIRSIPGIIN